MARREIKPLKMDPTAVPEREKPTEVVEQPRIATESQPRKPRSERS